jgi:hypothetical protein
MKTLCALLPVIALLGAAAPASAGTFRSSDPLLNVIWQKSVRTAADMLAPGGQTYDAVGHYCPEPAGQTVILDGVVRDRCSYIGDESVIDLTLDASTPHFDVQRNMLVRFAESQYPDGAIPSSPIQGGLVLFDYCGYWVTVLRNYVLYSGDVATGRRLWPQLVRLIDGWYEAQIGPSGLLVNDFGPFDYAFIRRHGTTVAYFNAQYVYVLRQAAELAGWLGHPRAAGTWEARATRFAPRFAAFWDPAAGAYSDTTNDPSTHPQDGNAFAVLAGIGTAKQQRSALNYLWQHDWQSYGNTIADTDAWNDPAWGGSASLRVYPFMSFYEVLAWFKIGRPDAAVDLIRREWGYMARHGPKDAMWETIGPYGGGPTDQHQSWDAGWSSGAAPALTQHVLGIIPVTPGFATFSVDPHPIGLSSASGSVTTPHGDISVSLKVVDGSTIVKVDAPAGTRQVAPVP